MAACTAWSFRGFSCCLKCSKLCNWYFQRWNCESSDRRTKESNLFCFIGPRYICLPSNYGKSLNYKVATAKPVWYHVVNITRCHGNLCTCATENVSDLGRVSSPSLPSTNRDLCQQRTGNNEFLQNYKVTMLGLFFPIYTITIIYYSSVI
jgi:hypothetical protein